VIDITRHWGDITTDVFLEMTVPTESEYIGYINKLTAYKYIECTGDTQNILIKVLSAIASHLFDV